MQDNLIFISWSGAKSKAAAEGLRDWLPCLFPLITPWTSSEDISPGKRWSPDLQDKLQLSKFGVICVTKRNLNAPWILYEAGCMSKAFENTHVCPVLIDLAPADIKDSPLSEFQAITLGETKEKTRTQIYSLMSAINKVFPDLSMSEDRLKRVFNKWYSELERKFNSLPDDKLDSDVLWSGEFSRKIRDFVCYHQGALIEYYFLAGEHHKELKGVFNSKKKSVALIDQKRRALMKHLNNSLAIAAYKSFDEIHKMYSGRHVEPPRICIKANYGKSGESIVSLFREKKVTYISDCHIRDNTGFSDIKENGAYYLCQDIPKAAKNGSYKNPRLIKKKVRYYKENIVNGYADENWVKCWRGGPHDTSQITPQHFRNCYKSTLIIPLTLWNNKMDQQFIDKFKMKDVDRTIFGYLCLDHISTEYFNPVTDVNSGYVYADILSLYLLVRFVYVNQSETYQQVIGFLKANGVLCDS